MDSVVQVDNLGLQSGLVFLPAHPIHSWSSLPLQSVKAVAEQINSEMVEQSGESFLLPLSCCLPHTAQSLGHSFPALCRARVGRNDVLLGPRPSLQPPRRIAPLCSAGSSVVRRGPTSPARACPPCG